MSTTPALGFASAVFASAVLASAVLASAVLASCENMLMYFFIILCR
jgi:hypothetical protein